MNTRRPGGGVDTSRREKCQWLGTRPEGDLGSRGRALKAATISAGFMPPAFLGLCLYIYSSFE